jgi:hypothetical protein
MRPGSPFASRRLARFDRVAPEVICELALSDNAGHGGARGDAHPDLHGVARRPPNLWGLGKYVQGHFRRRRNMVRHANRRPRNRHIGVAHGLDLLEHACTSADNWAWQARLPEDGLLHVVQSDEGGGKCREPLGTEWTFIRMSPSSPASSKASAEIAAAEAG